MWAGISLGLENFTDVDYADDVSLFAAMLEVLQLTLNSEYKASGFEVNWSKTNCLYIGPDSNQPVTVDVCNEHVEVADYFVHLGSLVHHTWSSEPVIRRYIEIVNKPPMGSDAQLV